jgi:type II secretion system protein H
MQARKAFTLIELMMVVVLIGVLAAVVVPSLKGPGGASALRASSRQFLASANIARQEAIAAQEPVLLRIDVENRKWRIVLPEETEKRRSRSSKVDAGSSTIEQYRELSKGLNFGRFIRSGVVQTRPKDKFHEIIFYPNGASNGGVVELVGRKERKMTVEIAAATARGLSYNGGAKTADELRLEREAAAKKDYKELERIGQDEEERVDAYRGIVDRMVAEQRRAAEMQYTGQSEADYFAMKEEERLRKEGQ